MAQPKMDEPTPRRQAETGELVRTINKVTILGRAGKDPEMKQSAGGTAIANISIATDDRFKDAKGEWQTRTEWHNLVAFGKTADVFQQYIRKGAKLYIEGKMQTQSWEKDGQKFYKTVVIVEELSMLDDKPRDAPAAKSPSLTTLPTLMRDSPLRIRRFPTMTSRFSKLLREWNCWLTKGHSWNFLNAPVGEPCYWCGKNKS